MPGPCTGFFEWKVIADEGSTKPKKQPYYIRRRDERVFALAGMWERWQDPAGSTVESYTILTTAPNDLLRSLHDRMPVIVRPNDYALWLDPSMQDVSRLLPLFSPFAPADFRGQPGGNKGGSPAHDDPACIQEIT
jgi:putative SOS response-associated peptidase YedK